jgi:hypothetical protein
MKRRKLSDYPPDEITNIKQLVVKASSYGLTPVQCANLVGLAQSQFDTLLSQDEQFESEYKKAKQQGINQASAVMHDLARKGNYQAASFILTKSPDSPYNDENVDPKQGEALQRLMVYMSNYGGLLPPPPCPHCGEPVEAIEKLSVEPKK